MKKIFTNAVVTTALALLAAGSANAASVSINSNTTINSQSAWNNLGLGNYDVLTIANNVTVTINVNITTPTNIRIDNYGTIELPNAGTDLTLSGLSGINLYSGAHFKTKNSSNNFIINTNNVPLSSTDVTPPANTTVLTANSFHDFIGSGGPITSLPLKFESFDASVKSSVVSLKWTATNDGPATMFAVQQSTDGKSWSDVATVKATGSDHETVSYSYELAAPNASTVIYRIRYAGTSEKEIVYSSARLVNLGGVSSNPSAVIGAQSGRIQIGLSGIEGKSATNVMVSTIDGKVVYNGQYSTENTSITIPVSASGVLVVTVTDGVSYKIAQKVAAL